MGVMKGKIVDNGFIVTDVFALPVEGTETRVNAMGEAYEYMVQYDTAMNQVGKMEKIVGWYHSHPGYGCWLSGIDVGTQSQNQQFQDPFLAIVIDPNRTISAGKVEIGAFRTYPPDYKKSKSGAKDEYQSIPSDKLADFGVHADSYYKLDISYFKSVLEKEFLSLLWNKYWVSTLSTSSLILNRGFATKQVKDLAFKTHRVTNNLKRSPQLSYNAPSHRVPGNSLKTYTLLTTSSLGVPDQDELQTPEIKSIREITSDAVKVGGQQLQALVSREIRDQLFINICKH